MNRKIHFMIGLVLLNILFAQEQPEQEKTKIIMKKRVKTNVSEIKKKKKKN